ncbi:MAG: DUF378 domain-containing protein [Verrucomicrobia bacterium]|nr:DUF378 domain-containing protein [Verrucomicrobiota bacterium]
MKAIGYIAKLLVIIGALNWGLVGFFQYDLVSSIFGGMTMGARVIFALVGLAGLYKLFCCCFCRKHCGCGCKNCGPNCNCCNRKGQ